MKDPLKIFIEHNREAFDTETPATHLLERTASLLKSAHQPTPLSGIPVWIKWSVAASLIAVISYLAFRMTSRPLVTEPMPHTMKESPLIQPDPLLQRIDPGSAREMQRMAREASQRESGLDLLKKDDPALYHRFLNDLAELDSGYNSLREMLTQTPNHQQLIEAMETNLLTRLQLLERQNQVIQDIEKNKKQRL
jgi:hypothetical protein